MESEQFWKMTDIHPCLWTIIREAYIYSRRFKHWEHWSVDLNRFYCMYICIQSYVFRVIYSQLCIQSCIHSHSWNIFRKYISKIYFDKYYFEGTKYYFEGTKCYFEGTKYISRERNIFQGNEIISENFPTCPFRGSVDNWVWRWNGYGWYHCIVACAHLGIGTGRKLTFAAPLSWLAEVWSEAS